MIDTHTVLAARESAAILVHLSDLPPSAARELHQALTLPNPTFTQAQKAGRWTGNLPATITYGTLLPDNTVSLPRGADGLLRTICQRYGVTLDLRDETHVSHPVDFESRIRLSEAQERAVADVLAHRKGQLVAPTASGKTIMALEIMARRQQTTLWLTHTKELANQARSDAIHHLGLQPQEIGSVGGGTRTIGDRLTIGMLQTLARGIPPELITSIGQVIVDEAHHIPATGMAAVLSHFPARYLLGLTATPYRRDGLTDAIGFYLGPITGHMDAVDLADRLVRPTVYRSTTDIQVHGDSFADLVTSLITNPRRNALILDDILRAVRAGRVVLALSDRVEHVEQIARALQGRGGRVGLLHGGLAEGARRDVQARLERGELDVLVATGQLVGEGFNYPPFDVLVLMTPLSWKGRVTQYVGRVCRTAPGKTTAVVIDYMDDHPMLMSGWGKRRDAYRAAGYPVRAWRSGTES